MCKREKTEFTTLTVTDFIKVADGFITLCPTLNIYNSGYPSHFEMTLTLPRRLMPPMPR